MLKRPPEHRATATPLFILADDDAWDWDRIQAERKETPEGQHPVDRYIAGSTRYDIDAAETVGGRVVCARDYLREGSKPTVFTLRRVSGADRDTALAVWNDPEAHERSLWRLARQGVVNVQDGFEGDPWKLQGGEGGLPLTETDMQTLYDTHRLLPKSLGLAVMRCSASLSEAEGKR